MDCNSLSNLSLLIQLPYRDENGFKCHAMSESHQRQLLLFADNPDKFLDGYSQEFEKEFMTLLSRQFGTKRVQANQVYNPEHHLRSMAV